MRSAMTVYISSAGLDTNDGTTEASPMLTITAAIEKYKVATEFIFIVCGESYTFNQAAFNYPTLSITFQGLGRRMSPYRWLNYDGTTIVSFIVKELTFDAIGLGTDVAINWGAAFVKPADNCWFIDCYIDHKIGLRTACGGMTGNSSTSAVMTSSTKNQLDIMSASQYIIEYVKFTNTDITAENSNVFCTTVELLSTSSLNCSASRVSFIETVFSIISNLNIYNNSTVTIDSNCTDVSNWSGCVASVTGGSKLNSEIAMRNASSAYPYYVMDGDCEIIIEDVKLGDILICDTAADVAEKEILYIATCDMVSGTEFNVKFTYGANSQVSTLDINGTGAKNIQMSDAITDKFSAQVGEIVRFIYSDGRYNVKGGSSSTGASSDELRKFRLGGF